MESTLKTYYIESNEFGKSYFKFNTKYIPPIDEESSVGLDQLIWKNWDEYLKHEERGEEWYKLCFKLYEKDGDDAILPEEEEKFKPIYLDPVNQETMAKLNKKYRPMCYCVTNTKYGLFLIVAFSDEHEGTPEYKLNQV